MATYRVSWPAGDYEIECGGYVAAVNYHYAENYEEGGTFTEAVLDNNGRWNCAYFGPPWTWNGETVEEPEELAAVRPNGVVMNNWEPPVDPEDEG